MLGVHRGGAVNVPSDNFSTQVLVNHKVFFAEGLEGDGTYTSTGRQPKLNGAALIHDACR